jgi:hypothetical protein
MLTLVAKTNVLTYGHDLWWRTFQDVAKEHPDIKADYTGQPKAAARVNKALQEVTGTKMKEPRSGKDGIRDEGGWGFGGGGAVARLAATR